MTPFSVGEYNILSFHNTALARTLYGTAATQLRWSDVC